VLLRQKFSDPAPELCSEDVEEGSQGSYTNLDGAELEGTAELTGVELLCCTDDDEDNTAEDSKLVEQSEQVSNVSEGVLVFTSAFVEDAY
jgi:hypothetical protein